MSEATWTPLSIADRKAANTRRAVVRATRVFHCAILMGFVAALAPLALSAAYPDTGVLSMGIMVFAVVAGRRAFTRRRKAEAVVWQRDADLIDEFRADRSWLVEILVLQGAAPTGRDRGILWVEDERLYFVGERTSFGLTADQTLSTCRFTTPLPGLRHDLTLSLLGGASLSFSPVASAKWQSRETVNELWEAVDRWSWRGEARGGQMPPLALGEDVPSEWTLLLGALAASAYLVVTLIACAGCVLLFFCLSPILVVVVSVVQVRWKPARELTVRWRAWQDQRRLRRLR